MEDFEIVTEAALTVTELIGRLHPVAVHLPIACTILLFLHECAAFFDIKGFRETAPYYIAVTLLSYLPAIATGWVRSQEFNSDALTRIGEHRNLLLLAFGFLVAVCGRRMMVQRPHWVYLLALLAALVLVSLGADIGGKLVYGEDYFGG